jgi:hypothetical protein
MVYKCIVFWPWKCMTLTVFSKTASVTSAFYWILIWLRYFLTDFDVRHTKMTSSLPSTLLKSKQGRGPSIQFFVRFWAEKWSALSQILLALLVSSTGLDMANPPSCATDGAERAPSGIKQKWLHRCRTPQACNDADDSDIRYTFRANGRKMFGSRVRTISLADAFWVWYVLGQPQGISG